MTVAAVGSPTVLRQLPVPETEAPLEQAPQPERRRRSSHGHRPADGVQGVLTLVLSGDDPDDEDFGPLPTCTSDLPDAESWSRQITQVIVEVIAGHRPPSQLLRWTDAGVYDEIRSQTLPHARPGSAPRRRPRVGTVRVCQPADGVAEVSAVVHGHYRTQALALRLEGKDGRWRVTALEAG